MSKKKITILGGGVCSLVTAFELTSVPNWQEYYDITIYQMGWRLGGKASSGRNRELADRVEEHGFHFWWGFYENAFKMIQQVYKELDRPPDAKLATWDEAFRPINHSENAVYFKGKWQLVPSNYVTKPGTPGTNLDRALPTSAEYICLFLDEIISQLQNTSFSNLDIDPPTSLKLLTKLPWWKKLIEKMGDEIEDVGLTTGIGLLKLARALACWDDDADDFDLGDKIRFEAVDLILKVFIEALWLIGKNEIETDIKIYAAFVGIDYSIAIMRGMINDGLLENSFNTINDRDFRQWLGENGARQITLDSYVVSGIYDMAFCYKDGDLEQPNVEAGSTLRIVLRMLLTYQGAFFYYMDAAMGDAVIAPMYLLLKERGVNFKFFHRVENLHIGADGRSVAAVSIAQQATPIGHYNPLYNVKGLPSWPSEPLYEQLVEGDALKERIEVAGVEIPKYNLESFWTPWQDVGQITLTHGQDYDLLILGIPLGSLPYICPEFFEVKGKVGDKWRNMKKYVLTNQTQALQMWLSDSYQELGWPFQGLGRPLVGEFDTSPAYVDTWADMSHLLKGENWPAAFTPKDLAFFVGVLKDDFGKELPPADDHAFPHQQFARAKENSLGFLREEVHNLWPDATKPDGSYPDAFNWSILVDMDESAEGEDRLNSQFWRANIDPSERYVLSVVNSTQYRIKTDETGYDNLFFTGDWIYNGANVGFVDSAVTSGMRTSQAITKLVIGETFPKNIFGWADY